MVCLHARGVVPRVPHHDDRLPHRRDWHRRPAKQSSPFDERLSRRKMGKCGLDGSGCCCCALGGMPWRMLRHLWPPASQDKQEARCILMQMTHASKSTERTFHVSYIPHVCRQEDMNLGHNHHSIPNRDDHLLYIKARRYTLSHCFTDSAYFVLRHLIDHDFVFDRTHTPRIVTIISHVN